MGDVTARRCLRRSVVAAVLMAVVTACTGAEQGAAEQATTGAAVGPSAAAASPAPSEPSERQQILRAYEVYTRLASEALGRGRREVDGLREVTTGRAWRDIGARIRANERADVRTEGRLAPSAADADVTWDGADTATITDCLLNGLSHVTAAGGDPETVEEATGTRRPVEARLRRVDGRWVVARVELVQDPDSENPQQDPPFLRGPMPDGPPSCAPPDLEEEILAGYRAFWDAFDRAFGFGRDGPADPDDPALAETSVDPQLTDTRTFFRERRRKNLGIEGEPDSRDPWLLALTDFDQTAFIADCRVRGQSFSVDLHSGNRTKQDTGQMDYDETRLTSKDGVWKVANWDTKARGIERCDSPD